MSSMPETTSGTDDLFANSSAETVVESIDFSLILKSANIFNPSYPETSHEGKTGNISVDNNIDLPKLDSEIVSEAVCQEKMSDKSVIANLVISEVCNFPLKLHCPFCCNNYISENVLKEHIKNKHSHLLKIFVTDSISVHSFHFCQFCPAKYYTQDLLIEHIIQNHKDNIIRMFQENISNKYITCGFCPYKVLNDNKQILVAHVEENHFTELKTFIIEKCSPVTQHENSQLQSYEKNSDMSSLNTLFVHLSTNENKELKKLDVNPTMDSSNSGLIQNDNQLLNEDGSYVVKRKFDNITIEKKPLIRRKLRFEVPDPTNFKFPDKENIISCSTNMKLMTKCVSKPTKCKTFSKWKSVFSFKSKHVSRGKSVSKLITSTPNTLNDLQIARKTKYRKHTLEVKKTQEEVTEAATVKKERSYMCPIQSSKLETRTIKNEIQYPTLLELKKDVPPSWTPPEEPLKQFKCAICLNAFVKNADLLCHTKQQHMGPLKLLHPSYKCGQCEAKFYKNSFLVKHCRFHHTPRCLKNKLPA